MADRVRNFLPWVRQGAAAGVTTTDTLAPALPAHAAVKVTLNVSGLEPIVKDVELFGPGDVTAIDPRQIIRVQPRPLTTNFESNLFPLIEFDRPDFPWLFTPAQAGAKDRLRPWICLVVVKKQPGVTLGRGLTSALPVLSIRTPAQPSQELPDLAESWAWAHAQVTAEPSDVKATLEAAPERNSSRLLCPRKLDAKTAYLACVVPAFEVGRLAGLGLPVAKTDLTPAWDLTRAEPVELPVYYSWEFSTGDEGDFETLVRALKARQIPEGVGTLPLDIGNPGAGVPPTAGATLPLPGLLLPLGRPAAPATPPPLRASLTQILNAPRQAPNGDPLVAPPVYGSTYPRVAQAISATNTPPHWINELNLDPRLRVAAGLGTQIVQEDQEHLMASAWNQVERIRRVNEERRRLQLARANREAVFDKHYEKLGSVRATQITARAVAKRAPVTEAPAEAAFVSATMRRITSAAGVLARRSGGKTQTVQLFSFRLPPPPVLRPVRLAKGELVTTREILSKVTVGSRLADPVSGITAAEWLTVERVRSATPPPELDTGGPVPIRRPAFSVLTGTTTSTRVPVEEFREAAMANLRRMTRPPKVRPNVQVMTGVVLTRLNPRLNNALEAVASPSDFDQVLAHPQFPAAMSERLIEQAPELLLPGLDQVPPETITLVKPNTPFIEAFMVGLNHEMGRELLWREFPTDQRGTYFRHFWPRPAGQMQQIHEWTKPLGSNPLGDASKLILLIRGELLRRYPTASVYAAKAVSRPGGGQQPSLAADNHKFPLFSSAAPPDVALLGFDLDPDEAKANWFFVIQQQPGEPDFGFDFPDDLNSPPARPATWNDVHWRHLAASAADLASLSHVRLKDSSVSPASADGAVWGQNAAHMARAALQQPVRIAIRANLMLP